MENRFKNLAGLIDATVLSASATGADIDRLCDDAVRLGLKSVCVNPHFVERAAGRLAGSKVLVCTVAGFPLGANDIRTIVYEAQLAESGGAAEVDVVASVSTLRDSQKDYLHQLKTVRGAVRGCLKVIIETALLTCDEIDLATRLVVQSGADFVKTSTGFSSRGASLDDIKIMQRVKQELGSGIGIKASGGIKTREFALELVECGATRLGVSSYVQVLGL